ncbi:hypothetical protein [Halomonas piscis]|uniref:hypothetical protein n=1 Tax=Halomonas piscis TaxID=3031727 RepID=UPI00289B90A0|nr:hypothetical protein [Halomonas piscis]
MAEEDDYRWEPSGTDKDDPASAPDDFQKESRLGGKGSQPSDKERLDGEILGRHIIGRRMSISAVLLMGLFSCAFFFYAIQFAHSFIHAYKHHVETWMQNGTTPDMSTVLPFMVPMVPAFFFSALGLITMITCMRFVSAYVNPPEDKQDGALLERLVREIAGAIKAVKGGGSGE